MTNLGEMLIAFRTVNGITGKDLAARIGIDPSILSRIESGKTPAFDTTIKILAWLAAPFAP